MKGKIYMTILNEPMDEWIYEFQIVVPTENENEYKWHSNWEWATDEMERICNEVGGVILHNVRVAHKEKRQQL